MYIDTYRRKKHQIILTESELVNLYLYLVDCAYKDEIKEYLLDTITDEMLEDADYVVTDDTREAHKQEFFANWTATK